MSEEEAIEWLKELLQDKEKYEKYHSWVGTNTFVAINTILDLYNKQKQEAEHYKAENSIRHKCLFNIAEKVGITKNGITESMIINAIDNNYISKDKVLKAIGYEENDEEYDRLKQDNEKLLAILDTLYSEVCRLEDIEDKKIEVAVAFIEEKRDKYWQDKIRKRLEKLKEKEWELSDEQGYWGGSELQAKIEELEELLEEK